MMKRLGSFAVVVVLALTVVASHVFATAAVAKESGKAAPSFTLTGIQGKTVSLADLQGQGLVLFFFTTWCPYCREKFPMLKELSGTLAAEGDRLIVIDAGETADKVRSFAQKMGISFDILLDKDTMIVGKYGVVGVPTFVLVDRQGRIVFEGNELPKNYKELLSA